MKVKIEKADKYEMFPFKGKDQDGNEYELNQRFFLKNKKPVLPVMGEFHFSRYDEASWEEELLKMQAGGVDIVTTYVFWIHHEEKEGEFDFTGSRNVRKFLETCAKVHMPVWFRIGPWAHGECRNGGFPDWLVEKCGHNGIGTIREDHIHEARTNDSVYLDAVRKFWERLYEESKGMFAKDGGPILGIQLENEYCHCGGPTDIDQGYEHMRTLKKMAEEIGFIVPFYTTTAWGGGVVLDGETIPVLGAYVDAPWAGHNKEMPACANFTFRPYCDDENIGTDLMTNKAERMTYDKEKNPFFTAELGGGLQVTKLRRTYPFCEDIEAQALCMLGAGANLLGYYMYHGGVNPDGRYSTLQESVETGYFNELPEKCYDFQTCIRENGSINQSYHALKKLHLFMKAFGDVLAPAGAYLPDECPENAEDMKTPRICIRYNHEENCGFLFVNDHQRLRRMEPVQDLSIEVELPDDTMVISHIDCETDQCAVIPFGLKMGETRLLYTNLSLLTKIGERYFFYSHNKKALEPHFIFEDMPYENMVVLTREEAEHAYVFGNKLYISKNALFMQENEVYALLNEASDRIKVYEETGEAYTLEVKAPVNMTKVSVTANEISTGAYELSMEDVDLSCVHDVFLHMDFGGDKAQLYDGEKLLTDWFSNGEEWIVALKRYGYPKKLTLKISPFEEGIYYDLEPKKGCTLHQVFAKSGMKVKC